MNMKWIDKKTNSVVLLVTGLVGKTVHCRYNDGRSTTFRLRFFLDNMTPLN